MSESNIGFCYIYFDLKEDQDEFPTFVRKYLKDIKGNKELIEDATHFKLGSWSFNESNDPSNIIWDKYGKMNRWDYFNGVLIEILLFLVCIILLSPVVISATVRYYTEGTTKIMSSNFTQYYEKFI